MTRKNIIARTVSSNNKIMSSRFFEQSNFEQMIMTLFFVKKIIRKLLYFHFFKTDNIKQNCLFIVWPHLPGLPKSDYINRLITLTVITMSCIRARVYSWVRVCVCWVRNSHSTICNLKDTIKRRLMYFVVYFYLLYLVVYHIVIN